MILAVAPIALAQTTQPAGVRVSAQAGQLIDALASPTAADRANAAGMLGKIHAAEAVEPLLKLLHTEKDRSVRWAAVTALGELDDPRAIAPLMDIVRNDPANRRAAALSLGQLEAWDAVDLMLEVLLDKDAASRAFAARGLKALSGEDFGEDATLWRNWWLEEQHLKIAPTTTPDDLRGTVVQLGEKAGFRLVLIPAGQFLMGGARAESNERETPAHRVKITKPFYLGQTEVTQGQYQAVVGLNPSRFKGADNPVESVSWNDAAAFCEKLSAGTGHAFRLPTEAEWEYACRAGISRPYFYVHDRCSRYAWNNLNSGGHTHPVGLKLPNAFGLNDMYGNVAEWCSDWAGEYPDAPVTDPQGPPAGKRRIVRGGTFSDDTFRSSDRSSANPDEKRDGCGFRVVMEAE